MNITNPTLPPATDVDALRTAVASALSNLVTQINQSAVTNNFDMGGNRVLNVGDCTSLYDAVNKKYIDNVMGTITNVGRRASNPSTAAYTIVSQTDGALANGDIAPAFVVGLDRIAAPEEVWIYAETAPITNCQVNWHVQLGGTGTYGTLLSTDLTLGSGSNGPVFATNFAITTTFTHGTVVKMVATFGGQAVQPSMGLVMKK